MRIHLNPQEEENRSASFDECGALFSSAMHQTNDAVKNLKSFNYAENKDNVK